MEVKEKRSEIYDDWIISKDHSVYEVGSDKIFPLRLQDRIYRDEPENWDSIGLEAASRVLHSDSAEDMADIALVARVVTGTPDDRYGSFITNSKWIFLPCYNVMRLDASMCILSPATRKPSSAKYSSLTSLTECGLHVHAQAPETLDVLRELALLLLIYEGDLSPPSATCSLLLLSYSVDTVTLLSPCFSAA